MDSIFAAFPKILGQLDDNPEAREAFAFAAWRRSVGESINERTSPVALSGSKLSVAVTNETWRRHLLDMAAEILFKLNSNLALSSVTFLDFFVDEKAVAKDHADHHGRPEKIANAAVEDEIMKELRDSAAAIGDADLRKSFLLAAASCLARTKRNTGDK